MKLNKLIQKINKENEPPEGWTPEAKEGAKIAGSIGLSLKRPKRRRGHSAGISGYHEP